MLRAHVPVRKVQGLRRDRGLMFIMVLLAGMVMVGGRRWPGKVSEGTSSAWLCVYVKNSIINSAIKQEKQ